MKAALFALRLNEFLCKVKTQLNTPHPAQLESVIVEHEFISFSHCLVDEKERVRCSSTLLFGICSSHFMIRVRAQMVTLLDGLCSALAQTHSRPLPYLSHRLLRGVRIIHRTIQTCIMSC